MGDAMSGATQLKIQAGAVTLQGSANVSEASLTQVSQGRYFSRETHLLASFPMHSQYQLASFPDSTSSCNKTCTCHYIFVVLGYKI